MMHHCDIFCHYQVEEAERWQIQLESGTCTYSVEVLLTKGETMSIIRLCVTRRDDQELRRASSQIFFNRK